MKAKKKENDYSNRSFLPNNENHHSSSKVFVATEISIPNSLSQEKKEEIKAFFQFIYCFFVLRNLLFINRTIKDPLFFFMDEK